MSIRHMNQYQLSKRWDISPRTLERWRWMGEGPAYLKIGGRVVYRIEDVEQFESDNLHQGQRAPSKTPPESTTVPGI